MNFRASASKQQKRRRKRLEARFASPLDGAPVVVGIGARKLVLCQTSFDRISISFGRQPNLLVCLFWLRSCACLESQQTGNERTSRLVCGARLRVAREPPTSWPPTQFRSSINQTAKSEFAFCCGDKFAFANAQFERQTKAAPKVASFFRAKLHWNAIGCNLSCARN